MRLGIAVLLLGIASCGGGSGAPEPPPAPFTISPADSISIQLGQTQFDASRSPVGWSIREGAAGGSIDNSGLYTAPVNLGTFHVVATSGSQTATTAITIVPAVIVFPPSDTLGPGGLRGFGVDVNPPVPSVSWTILEGPAGGSISGNDYTAPEDIGTYHLVATSTLDSRLSTTVPITVVPQGFKPVGDLNLPRMGHTATLLPNGEVLIAGGDPCWVDDGVCPLQETELFDPASGNFRLASNMIRQRAFHTATPLQNGQVLLAGGGSVLAELYDPATNAFVATGSMSTNRFQHTATLLPNGKVLIAGGQLGTTALSSAELYDPLTGTFSPTAGAGMVVPRSGHGATRLPNGLVLVTGGLVHIGAAQHVADIHASAELYDPVAESFTSAESMTDPRAFHAAVALADGTVLITGGLSISSRLDSAEIYDPLTGGFTTTARMVMPHWAHVAALLSDGTVLVTGGANETTDDQVIHGFVAEIYDPNTGTFLQTGSMGDGQRFLPAAVLLADGRVLLTGSLDSATAETYQ
jgi:hypothetical protein